MDQSTGIHFHQHVSGVSLLDASIFIKVLDIVANEGVSGMLVPAKEGSTRLFVDLGSDHFQFAIRRLQPKINIIDLGLFTHRVEIGTRKVGVAIHLAHRVVDLHKRHDQCLFGHIIGQAKVAIRIENSI